MASSVTALNSRKRVRRSFGSIQEVAAMPNLIEVQRSSYDIYLQKDVAPADREDVGLQEVFKSVFPIKDFAGKSMLEFVSYELETPKYDVEECQQRGITFASPLKVILRLVVWEEDEITGTKSIRDIKEQDVYMGDMPLMTSNGTFIVNGTERVIVSQMHRSPGVFFDHDRGKTHSSGKLLHSARVIPYRGSWLDFEFDPKDNLNVRIDRKRKLPATTFLMALLDEKSEDYIASCEAEGIEPERTQVNGLSREAILNHFYDTITYAKGKKGWSTAFVAERLRGSRLSSDLIDAKSGKAVAKAGEKLTPRGLRKIEETGLKEILVEEDAIIGNYLANDIVNMDTGEILAEAGDTITEEILQTLSDTGVSEVVTLAIDNINVGAFLRNTLASDRNNSREEALIDIYRVMRPGEPPTLETSEALFNGLFFDSDRYDLSSVGRVKLNARVGLDADDQQRVLNRDDVLAILRVLIDLKDGKGEIDDIDHLGNRRVRSVGELMENQYRIGLLRMERAIKERMGSVEIDTVMPADLINSKPAAAAVREFFGSSQLSQFMDQTNPLSEITHKRRLSALGPGGLTRERAGFEVRDVHPTHYGRICPIETPEGPNIGLINSLAT
ncbi:MAG: DNA-directed RNA polymerase subunit beta, partial [Alphaproteobacteria bacterium]|nr:DNA-directed RNA polymerase subunit beta [Alphaproteobacteria bacterium]